MTCQVEAELGAVPGSWSFEFKILPLCGLQLLSRKCWGGLHLFRIQRHELSGWWIRSKKISSDDWKKWKLLVYICKTLYIVYIIDHHWSSLIIIDHHWSSFYIPFCVSRSFWHSVNVSVVTQSWWQPRHGPAAWASWASRISACKRCQLCHGCWDLTAKHETLIWYGYNRDIWYIYIYVYDIYIYVYDIYICIWYIYICIIYIYMYIYIWIYYILCQCRQCLYWI